MPSGLHQLLTTAELVDLVACLETLKEQGKEGGAGESQGDFPPLLFFLGAFSLPMM